MYYIFPKFSGRARGKTDTTPNPPPHTIQSRGRCQIEVGPHVFAETSFYEVQYLPPAPAGSFIHSWQSPYSAYAPYGQQNAYAASPVPIQTTSPLLSSLTSVTTITPALINQVNAAAASNPTLANLLQLAAAGKASPEQLKTLGLLIQSLAAPESSEALSSAANLLSSVQPYPPPVAANTSVKDFDLVLQYHETSSERWIIPRGPVICEKVADGRTPDFVYDIILTLALKVPKQPQSSAEAADTDKSPSQVVSMRLKRPPPALWETIWRWVGGEEKLKENRLILDDLKQQNRVYLAHRLPQNALLMQLQNAAAPQYAMKSIKPGPVVAPRAKRKPVQRKPTQPASAAPQALGSAATSSKPTGTEALASGSSNAPPPEAKRRKIMKPPPSQIRCVSCQQTDVPLILGGRFCRPCVDTGKATAVYVPYRPPQYAYPAPHIAPAAPVTASATTGSAPPPPHIANDAKKKQ
ncbi:hypothetical protein FB451DRAFT_1022033 [Mycena latifolia]|nr:hypothetical protein FB451DRAFT_1022033 [Mycena latifolia]